MPEPLRGKLLQRNFPLMFWVQALMNVKFMNLVSTLFYLHRGLTLSQIFYTAVVFSATNILFEIPSSYLADKWGRKKTILFGCVSMFVSLVIQIYAHSFEAFIAAFIFLALSFALMSGTDEALVYDTNKELGDHAGSLDKMGFYHSARRVLKIISPLIGAFIAKDLAEGQFLLLLVIDIATVAVSVFLASRLTEPHHYMDVESLEKGTLIDAFALLRSDKQLTKAIFNKTLIFIASFIIWRFHQKFFIDIGVTVLVLGIAWTVINVISYVCMRKISIFLPDKPIGTRINILGNLTLVSTLIMVFGMLLSLHPIFLLFVFFLIFFFEMIRAPLFSEIFNKRSFSHNRATTLSLTNFVKSILEVPFLLLASILINVNMVYVVLIAFGLCMVGVVFFSVSPRVVEEV